MTLAMAAMLYAIPHRAAAQYDFCNSRNTSYKHGERLKFKVYYNMGFIWIYAGDATFTTTSKDLGGQKVFYIAGYGKTASSYEWFYKVRDMYETYVDQETMLPVRFIRDVNEGGLKFKHDVTFDHSKRNAVSAGKDYQIPACTQDVLSAIYFARNIDYSRYHPGDRIPFDMFLDDKVYSLYIKYLGKERIETKRGTFNAIKIAPLLIDGTIFSGGEKMTVWVSDDKNHIPLRVNSPITVGSIKVDLMEYDNLRNPFDALVSLNN
ncbi:DUF3108 domain-containing protein [Nemorincola caseinilytica]|uniref:DUF3108 domain-containing protein n=2 Tax=Nemorincola caseinilytica TaxID=2054315 RepID=A0ABP8NDA8_9BACT